MILHNIAHGCAQHLSHAEKKTDPVKIKSTSPSAQSLLPKNIFPGRFTRGRIFLLEGLSRRLFCWGRDPELLGGILLGSLQLLHQRFNLQMRRKQISRICCLGRPGAVLMKVCPIPITRQQQLCALRTYFGSNKRSLNASTIEM